MAAITVSRRTLAVSLLLSILLLNLLQSHYTIATTTDVTQSKALTRPKPYINCAQKCSIRCGKSWKPKMCLKLCNICCGKCRCVPPSPTAPKEAGCHCYATYKNPKTGAPKCP